MKKFLSILSIITLFCLYAYSQKSITFPNSTATYGYAAHNSAFNLADNQSFTVTAWVKTTSSTNQLLLAKRLNAAGSGYELWQLNGYFAVNYTHSNGSSSGLPGGSLYKINDGKWHQLAFVVDITKNMYYMYVDAKVDVSKALVSTTGFTNTDRLYFGIRGNISMPLDGSMDEVRIYNKALSQTELLTDMAATVTSSTDNLTAAWNFEEGSGTLAADIKGVCPATLTGSPAWSTLSSPATQVISMSAPIYVAYGAADFSPATSTSSMPIQYTTSDPSVATVVNGKIHIVAKGNCTITANQSANLFYAAATPVTQTLYVASTQITFNLPFTNHAVIQRDQPITVTGTADPNDLLTLNLDGDIKTANVDATGKWTCTFTAKEAKNTAFTLTAVGNNSGQTTLTDLLCGDVWVASGQSNMLMPVGPGYSLGGVDNYAAVIAVANYPNIRFIQPVDLWQQASTPQTALLTSAGGWTVCSPSTAGGYSAAAYFFAKQIHVDQNIPVGIIQNAVGGTRIEAWTPLEGLKAIPEYSSWYTKATTTTMETGQTYNRKNFPAANYNGMLAPYTRNPVKGIIWYQGEENLGIDGLPATVEYGNKFKATIQAWRNAWGISNLPVIYVQIANFQYSANYPVLGSSRQALPLFNEQMDKAMELNNVWGVPITDISNYTNIHPTNKSTIGSRMANIALKFSYGKTGIQPLAARKESINAEGSSVRVVFKNNSGFYMSTGTTYTGFEIAGINKEFKKAHAVLSGNDIILSDSTSSITKPVYVRFGWDENSNTNLFNDSNSPTIRFRDSLAYTFNAADTLQIAIDNARSRKALMTSGTEPGQYLPEVISAFNQKITAATAIVNNTTLTDAVYRAATDSMNAQTMYYKAAINYPKVSTALTEYWYSFSTPLRNSNANNFIAYQGDNAELKGETYAAATDKFLWKITKNADGTYNIISKVSGSYISPASAYNTALKAQNGTPTSGGWTFIPTFNNSYFAVASGAVQFNQTNNSGLSYKIYNWGGGSNTTDTGCQYLIKTENTNQNQQKIACVGNSITYGYTLTNPATESYPAQLQNLLGTADWTVGNYGVSSRTMLKNGNLPYWNETAYTNALASKPNYVMIELGTNDAKTTNWNPYGSQFVADYKAMIQSFRNLSSKPEVWIGLLPPGENTGWTIYSGYIKDSVNVKIKQVAIEAGTGLIDIYAAFNGDWTNTSNFKSDGIHPTVAGAAIIAQKVKEMITMTKPKLYYTNGKITSSTQGNACQWYYNGTAIAPAEGGTASDFTPTKTGKYKASLKLSPDNESRIISEEIDVQNIPSGLKTAINPSDLKIYNNLRLNETVMVEFQKHTYRKQGIKLYDLSGKQILCQNISGLNETVHLTNLPKSLYILEVFNNGKMERIKLIK